MWWKTYLLYVWLNNYNLIYLISCWRVLREAVWIAHENKFVVICLSLYINMLLMRKKQWLIVVNLIWFNEKQFWLLYKDSCVEICLSNWKMLFLNYWWIYLCDTHFNTQNLSDSNCELHKLILILIIYPLQKIICYFLFIPLCTSS